MLSPESLIDGLSATISLFFAFLLGLGIVNQAKKVQAKLLFYLGLNIFLAGFFWLPKCVDFLSIIIIDINLINPLNWLWFGFSEWIGAPIVILISMYICAELLIPDKKWYIILIYIFLGICYEIILIVFPFNSMALSIYGTSGEQIVDIVIIDGIASILIYVFMLSGIVFCGFGYLYKSFQSKNVIKKKFLLLSIGYFLFSAFPFIFNLLPINASLQNFFSRSGMTISFFFFYIGLREEPEKKLHPKKKVSIKESLFRLSVVHQDGIENEIDWRASLRYIYVIQRSGITLFSQPLQEEKEIFDNHLLGGAISAVSSIIKEIANNEEPLKVIKQEGFSILIEEGEQILIVIIAIKDYNIIRNKMVKFLEEFQNLFKDVLECDVYEINLYLPAKSLVSKYFK